MMYILTEAEYKELGGNDRDTANELYKLFMSNCNNYASQQRLGCMRGEPYYCNNCIMQKIFKGINSDENRCGFSKRMLSYVDRSETDFGKIHNALIELRKKLVKHNEFELASEIFNIAEQINAMEVKNAEF